VLRLEHNHGVMRGGGRLLESLTFAVGRRYCRGSMHGVTIRYEKFSKKYSIRHNNRQYALLDQQWRAPADQTNQGTVEIKSLDLVLYKVSYTECEV
jgi:hypothetical protein